MKKIEAVIRKEKMNDVKDALDRVNCPGMMVWEIEVYGRQQGVTEQFRGRQFRVDFVPKAKVEIVIEDSRADEIVSAIAHAAGTGKIGDGRIFVSNIEQALRIRTFGQSAADAV